MALAGFHPAVRRWFADTLPKGNVAQLAAERLIEHLLFEGSLPTSFKLGGKLNQYRGPYE